MLRWVCFLLFLWAACASFFCWFFFKRTKKPVYYYETSEWNRNGKEGVHYSKADTQMDSLVYLPKEKQICWFKARVMANVESNGSFALKFPNGGRLNGFIREGDPKIELVGLAGTSEEGVTETLLLHEN